MHYYSEMRAAISYIETHVTDEKLDPKALEHALGFSFAHIRDIFEQQTGVSIMRYVLLRKIMNSTFDLLYSNDRILDIALKYGFNSHETYCRAFKRITEMTPAAYRKCRLQAGYEKLFSGVYGISLRNQKRGHVMQSSQFNESTTKTNDSTILYGVPKVGYGIYGHTPYPVCLKSCSNYLGEDIDYAFSMVSSGSAFRLTWDHTCWNLGNVDVWNTFDEPGYIYEIGAKALGREFHILERTPETTKEEFIKFIRTHIDQGYPCIALGIIGPPEACIVAGYQDNGNTLLGWNFFQDNPQFGGKVELAENGYFICDSWWENTDTQAIFCIGDVVDEKMSTQEIISNASKILTGRIFENYTKGISAYDAWKTSLLNEKEFQNQDNLSLMYEKLMTHDDAVVCLLDGRSNASTYFLQLSQKGGENCSAYTELAKTFYNTYLAADNMVKTIGGWEDQDGRFQKFLQPEVRKQLASLIEQAKQQDERALQILNQLK